MRVGLRSAYICTILATKLMVTQRSGLIVNISSVGGMRQGGPLPLVEKSRYCALIGGTIKTQ